ncbi:MAG TPA: Ig-like domain-containing protein [Acidimicrobiales bacterium]|nr:Ig-like domain-containing protein [Acidimicrobiales bacterium]
MTGAGATPTGTATLTVTPQGNPGGAATYGPFTLVNGSFTSSISLTNQATYSLVANYSGSVPYLPSASTARTLTVTARTSTTALTLGSATETAGTADTFSVTVTGTGATPTGQVNLTATGPGGPFNFGPFTLAGGTASGNITLNTAGTYSVVATYGGSSAYTGSASAAKTLTITRLSSSTALTLASATEAPGSNDAFTATVTGTGATPTGTVTLTATGVGAPITFGPFTLVGGTVSGNIALTNAGTYSVVASYSGNVPYSSSASPAKALTIAKLSTATALILASATETPGATDAFGASVTGAGGTPTGTVTLTATGGPGGAVTFGPFALAGGTVSGTIALTNPAVYSVVATYNGDVIHASSVSTAQPLTVSQLSSATALTLASATEPAGTSDAFTATVTGTGSTPTGTVTLTAAGPGGPFSFGPFTLVGGSASSTITLASPGSYSVVATYNGNVLYSSSASTAKPLTVTALPSATHLTIGSANEVSGVADPFTATVSGGGPTPTGTVTLTADPAGDPAGDATFGPFTLTGGTFSSSIALVHPGTYSVVANYSGNGIYTSSASAAGTITVAIQTTHTTLTLASASEVPGASDPFTITVSGNGGVAPTGTVTIQVIPQGDPGGTATYGPFTLTNGSFASSISLTNPATYTIVATYAGNGDNTGGMSTSSTLTIT